MPEVSGQYLEVYEAFLAQWRQIVILRSLGGVLHWDMETTMPPAGVGVRAEQQEAVERLIHQRMVDDRLYEQLLMLHEGVIEGEVDGIAGDNVRIAFDEVERKRRIPEALAAERAKHIAVACDVWAEARKASDFVMFQPALEKMFRITKDFVDAYGYHTEPYEAVFADFEPGMKLELVDSCFDGLRSQLVPYVQELLDRSLQPNDAAFRQDYPVAKQNDLARYAVSRMGYDAESGIMHTVPKSRHPFTISSGPSDVRFSTRYDEQNLGEGIFTAVHECGHGLFEQGICADLFGAPAGLVCSYALHESQSRFWEVWIARSFPFWEHLMPTLRTLFPDAIVGRAAHDLFTAGNKPERTLIRVEADPVTYNLHVMLRYELERKALKGDIAVRDFPEAWNALMQEYVGVVPPDDARGVLQDVHWAFGAIGYFPTYTLGTVGSASILHAMKRDLSVDELVCKGELFPMREWLREHVHQHGGRFGLPELLARMGETLSADTFMEVLKERMEEVYNT